MTARSFLTLMALLSAGVALALPPKGVGISSWCGWWSGQVSKADCPELRSVPLVLGWNKLEPEPGLFEFDKYIGEPLRVAAKDDLYVTLMVWVRPATPQWLFEEKGVPRVYTDRAVDPLGKTMDKENNLHPYYLNPAYQDHFFNLIEAFGAYVNNLPDELCKRVVFVQSAEGSTGDGQPYKGNPIDKQYEISKEDWNLFRRETWVRYKKAFPGIPILVNSDANTVEENDWLLENMDVIALKHGMFSHGYHVSDNVRRLEKFQALEKRAAADGKPVLTRGEMDAEMNVYGWSTRNVPQALYWSGLIATHCRLDIWNIPHKALKDEANAPAFKFFNRYAGLQNPATSPRAFCALRDGLDASDFDRFPAAEFGGRAGQKRDIGRYLKITEAYAGQGARMDDPEKALGGGMVNRKRSGSNDVGWGILSGNYSRFLMQIEPGSGDIGLWNIDDSIYGRFARSFDHRKGKKQMRFKLYDAFMAKTIKVRVTYLDRGRGRWSICGKEVQNRDSGLWKTETSLLKGVTELELNYGSGDDTVFHLIEIEREQ